MKKDPVVHFEMPAEDRKRMSDFYSTVFGWETNLMGPEMSEYVVVTTTETDQMGGRPKTPGTINGGFYKKDPSKSNEGITVVISVDDINESMKKVTDKGGTILSGPDDIPGVGLYVAFQDTEGNRVCMLQPSPQM